MRHEKRRGGNKADYCPPERGLVLGQGGTRSQPLQRMNGWMDGWLTGCLDGRWVPRLAGWPACPQSRHVKGTGAGLGNARHDRGEQRRLLSPAERPCPGLRGTRSQPLGMDGEMDE